MEPNRKMLFNTVTFLAVAILLPITIFMVNRPQDIRQQASIESEGLGPTSIPGCPAENEDGTTNVCRAQLKCPIGETVKEDGNSECSERLQQTAICCLRI